MSVVLGEEAEDAADVLDGFGLSGINNVIDADRRVWTRFDVLSHPSIVLLDADGTWDLTTGQLGPWKLQDEIDLMLERAAVVRG